MSFLCAALILLGAVPGGTTEALVESAKTSTDSADQAIRSEVISGGYRIGILVEPSRTIWLRAEDGTLTETAPPEGSTHFIGVVVREEQTKRFLPGSRTRVSMGPEGEVGLVELWDARYPIYGANVSVPADSKRRISVRTGPAEYGRHGDMLASFVDEATADFELQFGENGEATVLSPFSPSALPGDYVPGNDVAKALGEAADAHLVGPYVIAFIRESPEPYWLWTGDEPTLRKIRETDTHHLEIALFDRTSGLPVTSAHVTLELRRGDDEDVRVLELHPLLSEFYHYGATVEVGDGDYDVKAKVEPPRIGSLAADRFPEGAEATFGFSQRSLRAGETLGAQGEGDVASVAEAGADVVVASSGNKLWLVVLVLLCIGALVFGSWYNRRSPV